MSEAMVYLPVDVVVLFFCVHVCFCMSVCMYKRQRKNSLFPSSLSIVPAESPCCFPPQRYDPALIPHALVSTDNRPP